MSRLMLDGLGCGVRRWGGAGKVQTFDRFLVLRWNVARLCQRGGGRPCFDCRLVLEDCRSVARHLAETRHGHGGCSSCRAPWIKRLPHAGEAAA